ncbi:hypothetical protein PRIPAC_78359 [Pristionchus pacificus]|uniref:G protein-coupled receptor n=1 Tax=Pristionchus pacificus TaxID=54126 RepID=A0A2A6CJL1_PRIPA|nr:hypothetical protein PRIPAC_78359 [Pristionchus pacificus]|eukprot:PDM78392.1 G protein-coupled receptor [Pristionchus pacificus]
MYADPILNMYLNFLRFIPSIFCFILNGMLVRMIFMIRNKELGTYRFLLLTLIFADMINALIHLVILPIPELYKNAFILGAHSWWISRSSVCFSTVAFSFPYCVLSFNFLYRLIAVTHPFALDHFKKLSIIALLTFIALANCIIWFAIVWHSGFHRRANTLYVWDLFTGKDDFPTYLKYDVADIEKYSKFVYWASLNLNSNNEPRRHFNEHQPTNIKASHLSNRNHNNHMQLLRALLLQALTPLITSYAPIACCCALPFLGIDHPLFSIVTPFFCALHPVLDEIVMISTVSQFRSTFIDWVFGNRQRKSSKVVMINQMAADSNGYRKNTMSPFANTRKTVFDVTSSGANEGSI